jgi:AraC-like DNA-binding protein
MTQNRQLTQIISFPLASPLLALGQDYDDGAEIPPHSHDSSQLIYATSGVMTVETDDGTWVVPPQRAVWVPAFVGHRIRMTGRVAMRTLYLDPDLAPIADATCCVVQVSEVLRAAILRAIDFDQPYPLDGSSARLVAVMLDEIRGAPTAPLHLRRPTDPRARRVALQIEDDPSDRRTIRAWAREAGTSERTLERLFREEVGTTFGAWRNQARLLRAMERLAAGDNVTTAALEVGFETPSAFIAMFRRAMGTTPARYFRDS